MSPAWGVQLRALLGHAQGERVVVVVDDDPLGAARADQTRTSLRSAKFKVAAPIRIAVPPAPAPDLASMATAAMTGGPAAVLLMAAPSTSAALARQLDVLGYTGTVATTEDFYQPTAPTFGNGLTVLVPYAPLEQSTAANRRLVADVEAFATGTQITPAVVAGYWAADQFLAVLTRVGRALTVGRFQAVANGDFSYSVPDTIGTSTWPAMHAQSVPCGALVQSDGSRYYVAGPYRCDAPILVKAPPKKARGKK